MNIASATNRNVAAGELHLVWGFFFLLSFCSPFISFIIHGELSLFELIENVDWRDSKIYWAAHVLRVYRYFNNITEKWANHFYRCTCLIERSDRRHSIKLINTITQSLYYAWLYAHTQHVLQLFFYLTIFVRSLLELFFPLLFSFRVFPRHKAQPTEQTTTIQMYSKTIDKW